MSELVPAALPRPLSAFIGRRAEIADLRRLLAEARLVTLVGPGGCGKSRLAIEVAAELRSAFPAGVAFAELAPIQDPAMVPETVAAALGIPRSASDRLADLVGGARLLLVVDNSEHLVAPVGALARRLLAACPQLVVMVTSREVLAVDGERCWWVPPLLVPPQDADADPAGLSAYDAVRLFCARCAEHGGGFELTSGTDAVVAAICRRLDGMPLALELAAARVRAYGLAEVLRRLEDVLGLLTHGRRGAVERHRTLRATLDWSHRLLDDAERRLFRRLALFVGPFDLRAVDAICPGPDLPADQVADVLHRLVDKSLVSVRPLGHGEVRYSLMAPVGQYALERLEEAREGPLRERHARWYGELAARLDDDRQPLDARVERMTVEYDNVRQALDWAAVEDPDLQAALVVGLRWFWLARGSIREAREAALASVARAGVPVAVRAALHREASNWSYHDADLRTAAEHAEEAGRLLDGLDDPILEASVLCVRGTIRAHADGLAGERDLRHALALLAGTPPHELLVRVLNNLTMLLLVRDRVPEALAAAEECMRIVTELRDRSSQVHHWLHTYGSVLLAAGRLDEAWNGFLQGLDEAVRHGSYLAAEALVHGLACVAAAAGDPVLCLELAAAARRFTRLAGLPDGDPWGTPTSAAEQRSDAALSRRAAAAARGRGGAMDLRTTVQHARAARPAAPRPPLTPRKREVVRLVAEGLTNGAIARRLSISERTVDAHLEQVRNQLGLNNRAQITAWAGRHLDQVPEHDVGSDT